MCEILAARDPTEWGLEPLPDKWANVEVTFNCRQGKEWSRIQIMDLQSGDLYLHEPVSITAIKCFGLFLLVNPLYFLFYTATCLIRLPLVPIVNCSISALFKELWHIVKIPFFFIGMELAALYGVFNPLTGRAYFAKMESLLHDGKTKRQARQHVKETERAPLLEDFLAENPKMVPFVGVCMQSVGNKKNLTSWKNLGSNESWLSPTLQPLRPYQIQSFPVS